MGNDNSGEHRERRRAEEAEEGKRRMELQRARQEQTAAEEWCRIRTEKQALQEQYNRVQNERNIQRLREEEKKKIDSENRFKEEEERKRINIEKQNAQKENTNKPVS